MKDKTPRYVKLIRCFSSDLSINNYTQITFNRFLKSAAARICFKPVDMVIYYKHRHKSTNWCIFSLLTNEVVQPNMLTFWRLTRNLQPVISFLNMIKILTAQTVKIYLKIISTFLTTMVIVEWINMWHIGGGYKTS